MESTYNPKDHEDRIYKKWEDAGYFKPNSQIRADQNADQRRSETVSKTIRVNLRSNQRKSANGVFSIVLPPPNVTGSLHMGHAAMLAIEDIMVRYHRMKGDETVWIPGTDHAAIATQEKVEKELYKKEEKTRHDLGREPFLRRVEEYAQTSHDTIVNQMKKMGASLDWSREAYTLDEPRNLAVRTAFKKMYDAGLIYRGNRIVNWDPKLQTTVSDDEIEWREEKAQFYYLKYGPFTIGTARPETKFGDKYVVMHPKDKRYAKYKHGDTLEVEWINGPIAATIIKDEAADPEFGTGVMTITPYHDATDFDIAERHKLHGEQIIDLNGKLLPIAGEFAGQHIKKARALIVEKLRAKGLVEKIDENYIHRIATNSRGGGVMEPQVLKQWFVDVNKKFAAASNKIKGIKKGDEITLKELMLKTVKSGLASTRGVKSTRGGQIEIIPKRFEKTYFHWIENLRDWCISRQIWYGHRIPVWYRSSSRHSDSLPRHSDPASLGGEESHEILRSAQDDIKDELPQDDERKNNEEMYVGIEAPQGEGWVQDPDTLDTWFSSGLWTFSTLGWPSSAKATDGTPSDMVKFHPTSVLETGYDILFFWVARMILMTGFLLDDIPFKTVYLHGLVRDEKGQKMSKSLGNIIDPLTMSEKYGADAVRLSLIMGTAPGNDTKISEDKIRGFRNFATKLWNIGRFIKLQKENIASSSAKAMEDAAAKRKASAEDKKNLKELATLKKKITKDIETFKFHDAAYDLYHYTWHRFADKIIESYKPRLNGTDEKDPSRRERAEADRAAAYHTIETIFHDTLRMLHPFIPFVTEALHETLFAEHPPLIIAPWQ